MALATTVVLGATVCATPASATVALRPVTHLTVSARSASGIALTWRNPTSHAFTSVVIRYARSAKAPTTPHSGSLLARLRKPHHGYTRHGLKPGTHYAFAVFATDGHGHYSKAARISTSTRSAATAFDGHWSGIAKAPGGRITEPVSFTVSNGSVVKFQSYIYGVCANGATDDVYLKGPAPITSNGTVARAERITPIPGYSATSSMTGAFHGTTANGTTDYVFGDCAEYSWTWSARRS